MKTFTLILVFIISSLITNAQIRLGNGMIYEDDPMHSGYAEGKVYKVDGSIITGLVLFSYADSNIRFKYEDGKDYLKFTPNDLVAFKIKNDSFATISNFSPEIYGTTLKQFYKNGFAKILMDGPITLFKHYSLQSIRNQQIVRVETFLVGRKEEQFSRLTTIPTIDNSNFNEATNDFFQRDVSLSSDIKSGKYNFLDLRKIVSRYNESYYVVEEEKENCEVVLIRLDRGERPEGLTFIVNDSITSVLKSEDLVKFNFVSRINKVCIEKICVYFRSDRSNIQYVECGFKLKDTGPFIQLVNESYAVPYVKSILRKKLKK